MVYIPVGQIVYDDLHNRGRARGFPLSTGGREVGAQLGDLGHSVEPGERGDLRD